MNDTDVPRELRTLRVATDTYLRLLRDAEPILEQWADVHRLRDPRYQLLLDEVRAATRLEHRDGTPVAIARLARQIVTEAPE